MRGILASKAPHLLSELCTFADAYKQYLDDYLIYYVISGNQAANYQALMRLFALTQLVGEVVGGFSVEYLGLQMERQVSIVRFMLSLVKQILALLVPYVQKEEELNPSELAAVLEKLRALVQFMLCQECIVLSSHAPSTLQAKQRHKYAIKLRKLILFQMFLSSLANDRLRVFIRQNIELLLITYGYSVKHVGSGSPVCSSQI